MNCVFDVELYPEDIEHFKIGCVKENLPTDRDQTFVFRNEKWQKNKHHIRKH